MEKPKQPVNYIQSISNFVKEIWQPALLILFGMFITFWLFRLGILLFPVVDFVNPVARIETILQTDFRDGQVLEASYSRSFDDDDQDTFSISFVIAHSEFDDFILWLCGRKYDYSDAAIGSNFRINYCEWDTDHVWGFGANGEKTEDSYIIHVRGYLNPRCNSTSMFTTDSPCF